MVFWSDYAELLAIAAYLPKVFQTPSLDALILSFLRFHDDTELPCRNIGAIVGKQAMPRIGNPSLCCVLLKSSLHYMHVDGFQGMASVGSKGNEL